MSRRILAATIVLSLLGSWVGWSVAQSEGNDPAPKLDLPGGIGFKFGLTDDSGKVRGRGEFAASNSDNIDLNLQGNEGQYSFANQSLSLKPKGKLFLDLRSASGDLSKHIEARPDGSSVTNAFSKSNDRLYEVIDGYDGKATINIYLNDQIKHVIHIEPNGALSVKTNAEPPKETAAIVPPADPAPPAAK
ncbi:MAG: hypothetical protein AB7O62_24290 [Pirellulales bacterium]